MSETPGTRNQKPLPGVLMVKRTVTAESRPPRIAHGQILGRILRTTDNGRGIAEIYRDEVLSVQTRSIRLLGQKCTAKIIHTLLGYEVKATYKRIHCPDHATACYLKLFTELGCGRIRIPYDPTITARLIPELEAVQGRLSRGVRELFPQNRTLQLYVLRKIYAILRRQIHSEASRDQP